MIRQNGYVLTGGPGAGKTTVIKALEAMGYSIVPESGRQIIQEQVQSGGHAVPWDNTEAFRNLMQAAAVRDYHALQPGVSPVFFDRALPDVAGYTKLTGLPLTEELVCLCRECRYNDRVFIFPPWEEIFCGDEERKQDFTTATATHDRMQEVYTAYGYTLFTVPPGSVRERVDFILQRLH
ncbi:AAA family ATPase [Chitinophaga solisilvae]|uniref:AAA family ATPase n=1 Tax=Chitinophaga solisilvae TaxID=1233460 RepID=UPI001369D35B|nr:AAA family ATPase [Chitinophaga solisilvae]